MDKEYNIEQVQVLDVTILWVGYVCVCVCVLFHPFSLDAINWDIGNECNKAI